MQLTKQQRAWSMEQGVELSKNTSNSKRHALCAMPHACLPHIIILSASAPSYKITLPVFAVLYPPSACTCCLNFWLLMISSRIWMGAVSKY